MRDFLSNLITKNLNPEEVVRPRLPMRFEPQQLSNWPIVEDGAIIENGDSADSEDGADYDIRSTSPALSKPQLKSEQSETEYSVPEKDFKSGQTESSSKKSNRYRNSQTQRGFKKILEPEPVQKYPDGEENGRGQDLLDSARISTSDGLPLKRQSSDKAEIPTKRKIFKGETLQSPESDRSDQSGGLTHKDILPTGQPVYIEPLIKSISGEQDDQSGNSYKAESGDRELLSNTAGSRVRPAADTILAGISPIMSKVPVQSIARETPQTAPSIKVTIGRIEVRATPAPISKPGKHRSMSSLMSLDEYMSKRSVRGNK